MPLLHPLVNRAIDLNLNGPSFGKIDVIFLLFGILAVTRRWTSLQDKGYGGLVIRWSVNTLFTYQRGLLTYTIYYLKTEW